SLSLLYSFPLKGSLTLLSGISGGVYGSQAMLPDRAAFTDYQVDEAGSAFQYKVETSGYQETQRFFAASIPLLLQYEATRRGIGWYVNGGARAILPLMLNVRQSARQLRLSGYYPDYNLTVADLPQHGFGTVGNWKSSSTVKLKPGAALSAAVGLSFPLPGGTRLYAGLFADYGITSLLTGGDSMVFATYSAKGVSKVQVNSVLKMPGAGRMDLLSYGLQIRLGFGRARPKPALHRLAPPPAPMATADTSGRRLPPAQAPANPDTSATMQAHPDTPAEAAPTPPRAPVAGAAGTTMTDQEAGMMEKPVLFGAVGETSLSDFAKNHLDQVAAIMLRFPSVRVSITGHICNSSTGTESVKIGEARAKAVANYLRAKGVQKTRMDVNFARESDPVVPNNPGANYQKRRVVIMIK
ncbi:MAG TPA: OmpA family protein, partial [Puia sp.]|nr:OmpA family protein [Puia sp.]